MPSEGARTNRSGGVGFAHPSQTVSGYLITHREQTLNVASHRFTLEETDRQTRFAEREKKAVHDTTALVDITSTEQEVVCSNRSRFNLLPPWDHPT